MTCAATGLPVRSTRKQAFGKKESKASLIYLISLTFKLGNHPAKKVEGLGFNFWEGR